ncbi:MAG: cyclic nucleotide-binding domain-containing protein [Nitrosomonadaceae bacterium]|jgi:CRP-like cAMP-binding protein
MTQPYQPVKDNRLNDLEFIGNGSVITDQVGDLISKTKLFGVLDRFDINLLASYMSLYRTKKKDIILTEGEDGDYMLLLIEGSVDILKQDNQHRMKLITTLHPGMIVGEMAVVDGEKRFATCIAAEPSVFAVLTRDALVQIIDNEPKLGAKILVQLLAMMSEHLRETGGKLVGYLKVN